MWISRVRTVWADENALAESASAIRHFEKEGKKVL